MNSPSTGNKATKRAGILLVIEDNDDQWSIMQQAMNLCFREVVLQRTATAEQTWQLLEQYRSQAAEMPRLILLDLFLPTQSDGWQLLEQLQERFLTWRRIPIVLLTNSDARANIEAAYQLGVSSYLTKPIELADWVTCFTQLRTYWWETVTLPPVRNAF